MFVKQTLDRIRVVEDRQARIITKRRNEISSRRLYPPRRVFQIVLHRRRDCVVKGSWTARASCPHAYRDEYPWIIPPSANPTFLNSTLRSCSLYSLHPPRQRAYSVVFIPLASQEMMGNPAQGRYRRSPARCQRGLGCCDLSVALTRSNLLQQTRAALHQGRGCHMTKASPWPRGKHRRWSPVSARFLPGPGFR